jgi:hypothetical protein
VNFLRKVFMSDRRSKLAALEQLLAEALKDLNDNSDSNVEMTRVMRIRVIMQLFIQHPYSSSRAVSQAVDEIISDRGY